MTRQEMIAVLQQFPNEQVFTVEEAKAKFSDADQEKVFSLLRQIDADGRAIKGRILLDMSGKAAYSRWMWDVDE